MTPTITIRPARSEDVPDLRNVYYQLYDERDAGEPIGIHLFATRPSLEDEAAWFDRQFRLVSEGDLLYLVVEVDGQAVGSCSIGRHGPTSTSEQAHVADLGILVRKDMRGKGLGTALLERALAEARAKFEVIYLAVFSTNVRARRLYERFGFVVCGRQPRAVKRGSQYFDLDLMALLFPEGPALSKENR